MRRLIQLVNFFIKYFQNTMHAHLTRLFSESDFKHTGLFNEHIQ